MEEVGTPGQSRGAAERWRGAASQQQHKLPRSDECVFEWHTRPVLVPRASRPTQTRQRGPRRRQGTHAAALQPLLPLPLCHGYGRMQVPMEGAWEASPANH